jgi:uncharacterized protein
MRMKRWQWVVVFGAVPMVIVLLFSLRPADEAGVELLLTVYGYYMLTLFYKLWRMQRVINRLLKTRDYGSVVEFLRKHQWYWLLMSLFFPFPAAPYFILHLFRKRYYRNHPRRCQQCQGRMRKLSEKADDAFLSAPQVLEEQLHSVDYDVWQCQACNATEKWDYLNRWSKYSECRSCHTHAEYRKSSRTIEAATYSSSGYGERVHACKYCGSSRTERYTIARLEESSSSSSGGGSSGGSWGGGSSSGGGASSSW